MRYAPTMLALMAAACFRAREPARPADEPAMPAAHVLAQRLCAALHSLPAERAAACCQHPRVHFERECTKSLSASLATGAVKLAPADVAHCEQAMQQALEGCDWVGPHAALRPEACLGVIQGQRHQTESCRSSLDCEHGLFCRLAGPSDLGVCSPPSPDGVACDLSVDALATYAREVTKGSHDECEGICERHRCEAAKLTCTSSLQCPGGQHCDAEGRCVPGALAQAGQSCVPGDCAGDLRCVRGRCVAPQPTGGRCAVDGDCRGACDSQLGVCTSQCS